MSKFNYPEHLAYPDWLTVEIDWDLPRRSPEECSHLASSVAVLNVQNNGGPFAAVITDEHGKIVSVGNNRVVEGRDCSAHAEIVALRRANFLLNTHNLRGTELGPLSLYSSCAPCIMCFGAIWWSGLSKVYSSTTKEDAQSVGFSEGPVVPQMWELLLLKKEVEYYPEFCRDAHALKAFEVFVSNGIVY